jgi:hypothetical protein
VDAVQGVVLHEVGGPAFAVGLWPRSGLLGDPVGTDGDRRGWVVGGNEESTPHVLVVLGPQTAEALDGDREHFGFRGGIYGEAVPPVRVSGDPEVGREALAALPEELRTVPGAPADPDGARCPRFAHVRRGPELNTCVWAGAGSNRRPLAFQASARTD